MAIARREQTGFTLIDLAVVLALITLGFVIYPVLGDVLQVTAAKGASEEIAGALRLTRQLAITKGNNHCIKFGGPANANNEFHIKDIASSTHCHTGTVVEGPTTITKGLTVVSPDNKSLVFNAIGGSVDGSGNYIPATLCVAADATATYKVQIDVTQYGGVRVKADAPFCTGS